MTVLLGLLKPNTHEESTHNNKNLALSCELMKQSDHFYILLGSFKLLLQYKHI